MARAMATPLLLSPGDLGRQVVGPLAEPEGLEQVARPFGGVPNPGDLERHAHVLERGEVRQEVERLEDEADVPGTEERESLLVEPGEIGAGDLHPAGRRMIETRQEAEEGGLAAAGRAAHADQFAGGDRKFEPAQDGEIPVAALDRLLKTGRLDHHGSFGSFRRIAWYSTGKRFPQGTPEPPAGSVRRGSRARKAFSASSAAPSAVGWIPSRWFSSETPADALEEARQERHGGRASHLVEGVPKGVLVVAPEFGRRGHPGQQHPEAASFGLRDHSAQVVHHHVHRDAAETVIPTQGDDYHGGRRVPVENPGETAQPAGGRLAGHPGVHDAVVEPLGVKEFLEGGRARPR